jgi:hypothetical protein
MEPVLDRDLQQAGECLDKNSRTQSCEGCFIHLLKFADQDANQPMVFNESWHGETIGDSIPSTSEPGLLTSLLCFRDQQCRSKIPGSMRPQKRSPSALRANVHFFRCQMREYWARNINLSSWTTTDFLGNRRLMTFLPPGTMSISYGESGDRLSRTHPFTIILLGQASVNSQVLSSLSES